MLLNQPQPFEVGEQLKSDTNKVDESCQLDFKHSILCSFQYLFLACLEDADIRSEICQAPTAKGQSTTCE